MHIIWQSANDEICCRFHLTVITTAYVTTLLEMRDREKKQTIYSIILHLKVDAIERFAPIIVDLFCSMVIIYLSFQVYILCRHEMLYIRIDGNERGICCKARRQHDWLLLRSRLIKTS